MSPMNKRDSQADGVPSQEGTICPPIIIVKDMIRTPLVWCAVHGSHDSHSILYPVRLGIAGG